MSVTRNHGNIAFTCDGASCDEVIETDLTSFDLAVSVLVDEGWLYTKDGPTWKHYCEDCKDEPSNYGSRNQSRGRR